MITGFVTADLEASIRVLVRGPAGQRQRIEAVIDTGLNGWLTLPPALISSLGLPWRRRGPALLADGRGSVFDICDRKRQGTGGQEFLFIRDEFPSHEL
jgi:predicted aspartyl protease